MYFADLYNWTAATPYFIKSERLFAAAGDRRNALYAHVGAMRENGPRRTSLPELSSELDRQIKSDPILRSDAEVRMFAYRVKGDFDRLIDVRSLKQDWIEVRELARLLNNVRWQNRARGELGFVDFFEGDLASAQRNVGAALIGAMTTKDVGAEIYFLSASADGLIDNGMTSQGLQYANRAIALAATNPDAGYPMIAEHALISAFIQTGKFEAAHSELAKMRAQPEIQSNRSHLAGWHEIAAHLAQAEHHNVAAIAHLEQAVDELESVKSRIGESSILSSLSRLYEATGKLGPAEAFARRAADSAQTLGYISLVLQYLYALARIQTRQRKYAEADRTYDRAGMVQDIMVGNADTVLGKTALINNVSDLYAAHFALLTDHGRNTAKAFSVVEQARGRVFTDLLRSGSTTSPESVAAEHTIATLRLKLMKAKSDRALHDLRDAIFLAEQSRSVNPEVSILKAAEHRVTTLAEVQRSLGSSEAVLEFVLNSPMSYCLVITNHTAQIVDLSDAQTITSLVSTYLNEVKAKRGARAEARALYGAILAPLPQMHNKERLIVVRDGPLHLVPFDALVDENGKYVVESKTISYAPSATAVVLLRSASRQPPRELSILAVGGLPYDQSGLRATALTRGYDSGGLGDLPASRDEALLAAAAFPQARRTMLLGRDATESAFKKSASQTLIHLAVHAIVNEKRSDRSALVLLSDPDHGEDGFLQSSEIAQLSLNAELVTLSACDTAVGPISGQEGISTLSRAFE